MAEGGSFRPTGEPDIYDLELRHASGTTLAFADRPDRIVRLLPTEEALEAIGFTSDPPNAALVTGPADGEVAVVVELLDGRYDAASGSLRYQVRTLGEIDRELLTWAIGERAVVAPPESFGPASLFIDDVVTCYGDFPVYCPSLINTITCCAVDCCGGTCCDGPCCNGVQCCGSGQMCAADGTCVVPTAPAPIDVVQCGSAMCPSAQCCNGNCCDAGQSCCDGRCCDAALTCCNGRCCDAGLTCCRGQCVDGACT
jgi:hypothetical protein